LKRKQLLEDVTKRISENVAGNKDLDAAVHGITALKHFM
jgi:hypothetical protein